MDMDDCDDKVIQTNVSITDTTNCPCITRGTGGFIVVAPQLVVSVQIPLIPLR